MRRIAAVLFLVGLAGARGVSLGDLNDSLGDDAQADPGRADGGEQARLQAANWPGPSTAITERAPEGEAIILAVFGPAGERALAVAICEVGETLDPAAVGAEGEVNLFQIHPIHFDRFDADLLASDSRYNTAVAYILYAEHGYSFEPWSCQP